MRRKRSSKPERNGSKIPYAHTCGLNAAKARGVNDFSHNDTAAKEAIGADNALMIVP